MNFSDKLLIVLLTSILKLIVGANLNVPTENLPIEQEPLPVSLTVALVHKRREIRLKRVLVKPNQLEILWPHDLAIIRQMADWEFAYFKTALEQLGTEALCLTLNKENFSYKDFGLICELMEGTKKEWTTIELIDLLIIGEQFLASGEAKKKITFIIAVDFAKNYTDKKIVTMFPHFEVGISQALDALQHPSVSIKNEKGHEFLQLDCDKVPKGRVENVMKCLLLVAKCFNYIQVVYFKFYKENLRRISELLKNESIVFYQNYVKAIIYSGEDFEVFSKALYTYRYFYFLIVNSKSISSSIKTIAAGRLTYLDIFNSEMKILSLDLDEILSKIEPCKYFNVSGDFDDKSFEEFYFKLKARVLKNKIESPLGYASHLRFFTSLANQIHYKKLFKEKDMDVRMYGMYFNLDLAGHSCMIAEYESTDFSSKILSHLCIIIKDSKHFHLLNNAFNNTGIISVNLKIYRPFNQFNELIGVLKQKSISSLTLSICCTEDDNALNFFVGLSNTLFWNGLKYLNFSYVTQGMMLKGLEYLPQNLEQLELEINESSNGQFGKLVDKEKWEIRKNEFVKELKIICRNEVSCTDDLEQLPLLFPNLRKLIINGQFKDLKPFKIKNNRVKKFKITCESLEDEDDFINELMKSKTLTSVYIKIGERVITWKRDGRIYAEIVIRPKIKRPSIEKNDFKKMRLQ